MSNIGAYLLLGPSPFLPLDPSLAVTVVGLLLQGVGISITTIASLNLMMATTGANSESGEGIVTSLWVTCELAGNYLGSTLGGVADETLGFRGGTLPMLVIEVAILLLLLITATRLFWKRCAAAAPDHHHQQARGGQTRLAPGPAAPSKNIAELAIATPQLSTLLVAVRAAELVDTLTSAGPFTVFAPTNEAFAKLPKDALNALLSDKEALIAVLLRHVVPGAALTAQDLPVGSTDVKTAGGEGITVTRDNYIQVKSSAGGAGVLAFDLLATNGVVHLVDTVF